jgi:YVTN family beta-propeller protein
VISRRAFLTLPIAVAACGRRRGGEGYQGYAFVANQEGQSIAAIDLETLAVARHIPLSGAPSQVMASATRPAVYALTPATGTVHEIDVDRLNLARKLTVAQPAVSMDVAPDALFVLAKEPRALVRVNAASLKEDARIALPEEPVSFALAPNQKMAAVASRGSFRFVDLDTMKLREPAGSGDFGALKFLADSRTLVAANRGQKLLSLFDTASSQLIAHLPLSVRPDNLCFNADGGQLFITGEGMDAVVVVFPFHTPQVAETVLAGHGPGPMAASRQFVFIANPSSGDVSVLEISSRRVIAVVSVGTEPGFISVTPDDQYVLVLNRTSGDVSVLRTATITKNRNRRAAVLTAIPVGARPVSAAVRAV